VLNSISFCYWAGDNEKKWTIEYKGNNYDGAKGMIACIGRAKKNIKKLIKSAFNSGYNRVTISNNEDCDTVIISPTGNVYVGKKCFGPLTIRTYQEARENLEEPNDDTWQFVATSYSQAISELIERGIC
jgi:hypothetical protein